MANPQVWFLGKDLFDLGYVASIPEINETKGLSRSTVAPSDFSISLKNFDNTFSEDNPRSILNNVKWLYSPVLVNDSEGITIINGIAKDLPCDDKSKTATLEGSDTLFQNRKTSIAYASSAWETPADVLINIFAQESFTDFNNASLLKSQAKQSSEGLDLKVNFLKSDNMTLFDILEKMCVYGCADAWTHLGKVYYQHWQPFTGGVSFTVEYSESETCPMSAVTISRFESDLLNEYYISYTGDGNVPATDTDNNSIGAASRTVYGSLQWEDLRSESATNQQIALQDLTAAVYLGECRIKRCHRDLSTYPRPLRMVEHDISVRYKDLINIGTYYRIISEEQGWVSPGKIFEVYEYTRNEDTQVINLKSLEVE